MITREPLDYLTNGADEERRMAHLFERLVEAGRNSAERYETRICEALVGRPIPADVTNSPIADPAAHDVIELVIGPDCRLRFVWQDDLAPMVDLGPANVRRASHVEPIPDGSGWMTDLSPSGGPVLGPFGLRAEALAAEIEWLKAELTRS